MAGSANECEKLRRTAVHAVGPRRRRAAARLAGLATPDAARCLAEVFIDTDDERVAAIARGTLAGLTEQDAVDSVCEVAIATGEERLGTLVTEAGLIPADPQRRALLLLLTGRHEQYAELDFDGTLLRAARQGADAWLRRRIGEQARAAGWVKRIVAAETDPDLFGGVSDDEWDSTLSRLTAAGAWEQVWRLAQEAPLPLAGRLLRTLGESGWRPDLDRDGYARLVELARRCRLPLSTKALFEKPRVLVKSALFGGSPDVGRLGDLLAVLMAPSDVRAIGLWRLPTGEPAGQLKYSRPQTVSVAVVPDGSIVAAGGAGGVSLLATPTGKELSWLPTGGKEHVTALSVTPDGELLIGSSVQGKVHVWRLPSGKPVATLNDSPGIPAIAVTPDSRLLVVGGLDRYRPNRVREVRMWQLPSGKPAGAVEVGEGGVRSLLVTPDGRFLVAVGTDGTTQILRLPSGAPEGSVSYLAHHPPGSAVVMSADGTLLAGTDPGGHAIEVRRVPSAELVTRIDLAPSQRSGARRFAISADNRLLFGMEQFAGPIQVWGLPSGEPAGELPGCADAMFLDCAPGGVVIAGVPGPGGRLLMWRSDPVLAGRTPLGQVSLADVKRFERVVRPPADRSWLELLRALVRWRQRHDIGLADADGAVTDIEVSG